MYVQKIVIKTV